VPVIFFIQLKLRCEVTNVKLSFYPLSTSPNSRVTLTSYARVKVNTCNPYIHIFHPQPQGINASLSQFNFIFRFGWSIDPGFGSWRWPEGHPETSSLWKLPPLQVAACQEILSRIHRLLHYLSFQVRDRTFKLDYQRTLI